MHIKRFEAASMPEALALVRAELGEDALILSSRTIRRRQSAFGLLSKSRVEVQAALERSSSRLATSDAGAMPAVAEAASAPTSAAELGPLVQALQHELARLRGRERFEEEVRSELRGLRKALAGALGQRAHESVDPMVATLVRSGLDWMHAESLSVAWREESRSGSDRSIEDLLRQRIEARLAPARPDEGDRLRILVGAPGVGKTTSLAKLAARNDEGEREIALVSFDHFRIGATDQLKAYAALLDAPFREVRDVSELPSIVEGFRGRSILVDTSGRSASEESPLDALGPLRESLGRHASLDLVIDATARREIQSAQLCRFAPLEADRLLLAKTDECDSLAEVANLLLDEECPRLCWLGTGQRVPEDLRMADANVLVRDVLGRAA